LLDHREGGQPDGFAEVGVGTQAIEDGLVDEGPQFALAGAVVRGGGDEDDLVIGLSGEELFFALGSGGGLPLGTNALGDDDPVLVKGQVRRGA